jgi:dihydrolipoamide dehydrogenase
MRTALVERELVGGECAYWACIPSKTLLRPPEVRCEARRAPGTSTPQQDWEQVAAYRDYMVRHLDDSKQVEGYERDGVRVYKGRGELRGRGQVSVGERLLEAEHVIIATGSDPVIPEIQGLHDGGYWTNREATNLQQVPDSVVVLGGGPVGVELGQFMRRFGAAVSLVEAADRLLAREDPRVSELLLDALKADGIEVHLGAEATSVSRNGSRRIVRLANGDQLAARELLVAVGRAPRVGELGLDAAGIEPNPNGIEVDERCRAADGVWAIGDVTGVMPFTHVAGYQARIASADIAGEPVRADYSAVPRVVFCDPEIAAVGLTEDQARERAIDVTAIHVDLPEVLARPWTYETEPRGELTLVADRERKVLVGAWAVAPLAGEWIHFAALAIKAQIPISVLRDAVPQFPTYSEGYQKGLERLEV